MNSRWATALSPRLDRHSSLPNIYRNKTPIIALLRLPETAPATVAYGCGPILRTLSRRGLGLYLKENRVGHLFASPADISWSDDTLVQPDLFVADFEQARTMDWAQMKKLLLVIEVMSPSTARYDRFTKRRFYQDVRIPAYWIVNGDEHFVEVWTPDSELPGIERERVVWSPGESSPPLMIDLKELFNPL